MDAKLTEINAITTLQSQDSTWLTDFQKKTTNDQKRFARSLINLHAELTQEGAT